MILYKIRKYEIYLILIVSVIFQSFSFLLSKLAANEIGEFTLFTVILNKYYLFSIICLGIQAFFWQIALTKIELSKAYPFNALIYFFILLYSFMIFKESISAKELVGIALIIAGILFLNKEEG